MGIKINKLLWGKVKVGEKDYFQVLIWSGKVEERDESRLEELFGTTHRIGSWETKKLLVGDPEVIIIATGFNGVLEVGEKEKFGGVHLKILKSQEAVEEYNRLVDEGKRVNILVHTTC